MFISNGLRIVYPLLAISTHCQPSPSPATSDPRVTRAGSLALITPVLHLTMYSSDHVGLNPFASSSGLVKLSSLTLTCTILSSGKDLFRTINLQDWEAAVYSQASVKVCSYSGVNLVFAVFVYDTFDNNLGIENQSACERYFSLKENQPIFRQTYSFLPFKPSVEALQFYIVISNYHLTRMGGFWTKFLYNLLVVNRAKLHNRLVPEKLAFRSDWYTITLGPVRSARICVLPSVPNSSY